MDQNKYFSSQRSEEVQHIINRMPTKFGFWISMIVLFLFILICLFGWFVRYPDTVSGQISVSSSNSPLKLIANTNGRLKLNSISSLDTVEEGQLIAYIENATNPKSVLHIDSLLKTYNPNEDNILNIRLKLPTNVSLGELNTKYYAFTNSLREYANYKEDKLSDNEMQNLFAMLKEQKNVITTATKRVEMAKNSLDYTHKFYTRDSLLFSKKVISESELDKGQMSYNSSKDALQNAISNLINSKQSSLQLENKMKELAIKKPEKEKELKDGVILTFTDLQDNIKSWEQRYVFKAPFAGRVQFLKFYTQNQFVQAGEQVFTVVPNNEKAFGEVVLMAQGSGKIKEGQEVIIKLDNYPYLEYGSVTGVVRSISLTTNTTKTDKSEVETYMVLVDFPNQLTTNYGKKLDFRAESKGLAEIITVDRRLIERLFGNLKYAFKK